MKSEKKRTIESYVEEAKTDILYIFLFIYFLL